MQQKDAHDIAEASLDNIDIHVLKADTDVLNYIFPGIKRTEKLSKAELLECERLVQKYVVEYNSLGLERFEELQKQDPGVPYVKTSFTIELEEYGRQYIAVIENGQKIVYGNFFCEPKIYTRRAKEFVLANDGGNCYFSMKINLNTKEVFDHHENGHG
ncbi:MAG: hypothetical protein JSS79_15850 [Bacteroidetes bacterium]|nr:hypothetical protein [Bacteroidota bacterium]